MIRTDQAWRSRVSTLVLAAMALAMPCAAHGQGWRPVSGHMQFSFWPRGAAAQSTKPAAAASFADTLRGRDLLGCYRLVLGPWSEKSRLGPPTPTEVFRLDSSTVRNGIPGERAAARLSPADLLPPSDPRSRWLRPASWRVIGPDSLEVYTWSTGMEAEVFYGRAVGAELRGVLRRTSDAIPMNPQTGRIMWDAWPWAQATARRVTCP